MTSCSNWADAIADCALGTEPGPALAEHLAVCPQCASALRESRAMAARIDEALDRRAGVEPPLYGPERVMARVAGQAEPRQWWRWAVVGCMVVLMAIVMWIRRPRPEVTALSTWRSPTEQLLRPPVAAAWTTTPRLGEGFFKIKSGEIHAQ
jgi:anti-sigma factor RsiW